MSPLAARAACGFARLASGLLVLLGTLGLIRTHLTGFTSNEGVPLFTFTASPLTHVLCLVAGLVGVAMALQPGSSRSYALWIGAGGVIWGLLEFVLRDGSADIFGRDRGMAVLTLAIGITGLAVWVATRPMNGGAAAHHTSPY